MNDDRQIRVESHVARDFLQNAAYFNTIPKIVWEYVSNSLDAARDDRPVTVHVDISSNRICIADNGRGMSREELEHFFQMHGETTARQQGRYVRGRFGTGKCAAFGLASCLRIDTVQGERRNTVTLSRADIEAARSGSPFPVTVLEDDVPTSDDDGTVVEITQLQTPHADVDKAIAFIEKQLSHYHGRPRVVINGHVCQFEEPVHIEEFERKPPADVAREIHDVTLTIKVAAQPLDEDTRGVDILSNGIWHETTLAGVEKRELANMLFGSVDVPVLEQGEWTIPPFDNTRNNVLNRANPAVAILLGWLAEELETVRQHLVAEERARRDSETAKRLQQEADRIADVINEDFAQQERELDISRGVRMRAGHQSLTQVPDPAGILLPGNGTEPTAFDETGAAHGHGTKGPSVGEGEARRPGPGLAEGAQTGTRQAPSRGTTKKRRGAFSLEYEHATRYSKRSRYDLANKTIFINLDHPQVHDAFELGGGQIDSKQFRAICYEVAAVEYAIALPFERIEAYGSYPAEDALFEVKDTIDRITKRLLAPDTLH